MFKSVIFLKKIKYSYKKKAKIRYMFRKFIIRPNNPLIRKWRRLDLKFLHRVFKKYNNPSKIGDLLNKFKQTGVIFKNKLQKKFTNKLVLNYLNTPLKTFSLRNEAYYHIMYRSFKAVKSGKRRKFRRSFYKNLSNSITNIILLKNNQLLFTTIQNFLYWRHYKKHNVILFFFKKLFKFNKSRFLTLYNLKGISIILKGKLRSIGGAKKRKKIWTKGEVSTKTSTETTINYKPMTTPTGTLNLKIKIN